MFFEFLILLELFLYRAASTQGGLSNERYVRLSVRLSVCRTREL